MAEGGVADYFSAGTAVLEPDVVAELKSIASLHSLSAEDMYFKWEAYCMARDMDAAEINMQNVRAFKTSILDALKQSSRQHHAHIKTEKRSGLTPRAAPKPAGDMFGMLDGLVPNTPGSGAKLSRSGGPGSLRKKLYDTPTGSRVKHDILSSPPDYKKTAATAATVGDHLDAMNTALPPPSFPDRNNPGEVIMVLNEQLAAATAPIAPYPEPRIKLSANSDQRKLGYKPMVMKLSEASETLDDRIDDFRDTIEAHYNIAAEEFGNPTVADTAPIVAVGRIAVDAPAGGRLNAASVVLESSRKLGGGVRVLLNLHALKGFAVFPGQIVALRGINPSGSEFVASELLEMPILPFAASTPSALEAHRQRLRGFTDATEADDDPPPLSVWFASGPYTADDNLGFEPLHELCSKASDEYVDALVLTGPFLDIDHPMIASGDFDLPDDASYDPDTATLATVFKHLVAPAFQRLAKTNPSVSIILVPSTRDAIANHVSWPQDAMGARKDFKDLGLPRPVRLVTNPITVSLNEAMLAISSHDVLYELKAEELAAGMPPGGSDTLARLARHLVEQRHYYPIFPPTDRSRLPKTGTAEGIATGAMLDTSYLKLGEMLSTRPDIIMSPSAMPPFIRVVEGVFVINPGTLSKRRGAGTFVRMALHAPAVGKYASGSMAQHMIFERARMEIVRI